MSTIIQAIEKEQMANKNYDEFSPGDTIVVQIKVKEGTRERLQAFEGVVIGKRNRGSNSSFTVRKISHGVGVERVFPTYSTQIASITRKRRGDVRQAKLYYLRELSGRKARIKEKLTIKTKTTQSAAKSNKPAKAAPVKTEAKPAATPDATDNKTANDNKPNDNQEKE